MQEIVKKTQIRNGGVPILARVSSIYPLLNEAERRVADVIVSEPEKVRTLSVTRLGEMSGVSQTTVVRFCRDVGFDGYSDFKVALIEGLVPRRSALPEEHGDVEKEDSLGTLLEKVVSADMRAVGSLLDTVDVKSFERMVELLSNARFVEVLGVGSSLPMAMLLQFRLMLCGIQSRVSVESHLQAMNSTLLRPGDVALAISYSGETQDILDAAELAKNAGASTICIVSSLYSSLAKMCDVSLMTASYGTRWSYDSMMGRMAQFALFDAISIAIARGKESEVLPIWDKVLEASGRKLRARKTGHGSSGESR